MANRDVTVITLTRGRPRLLLRAIDSVGAQRIESLTHLIVVDGCPSTAQLLADAGDLPDFVRWTYQARTPADKSGPARSARLRNLAVDAAGSDWIAFLDDDNTFSRNHLEELLDCSRFRRCTAAHSWRRLFHQSGRPFTEPFFPWCQDSDSGERLYRQLCREGVFDVGSNLMRDRAYPAEGTDGWRTVDTSEWLIARELLSALPFPEDYSEADCRQNFNEDHKLLERFLAAGIRAPSTSKATLNYFLGGYSNEFREQAP